MRRCNFGCCVSLVTTRSEEPFCWLCFDHGNLDYGLCGCAPHRVAHAECLARWRFVKAGTLEEHHCRFCQHAYPPLSEAWPHLARAEQPVMTLTVNGVRHAVPVAPGPAGMEAFQADVRRLFGLQYDENVEISFSCVTPGSDIKVTLAGWGAYDAALMAAAIACASGRSEEAVEDPRPPGLLQRIGRWLPRS